VVGVVGVLGVGVVGVGVVGAGGVPEGGGGGGGVGSSGARSPGGTTPPGPRNWPPWAQRSVGRSARAARAPDAPRRRRFMIESPNVPLNQAGESAEEAGACGPTSTQDADRHVRVTVTRYTANGILTAAGARI
jgi:hypothetical protein